jgi:hypothetical protein
VVEGDALDGIEFAVEKVRVLSCAPSIPLSGTSVAAQDAGRRGKATESNDGTRVYIYSRQPGGVKGHPLSCGDSEGVSARLL